MSTKVTLVNMCGSLNPPAREIRGRDRSTGALDKAEQLRRANAEGGAAELGR